MDPKDIATSLTQITGALTKAADTGDLDAIVIGIAALEKLVADAGADQQQQHDPLEEDLLAAAHEMEEAGELEIIREEGKDTILKLRPTPHDEESRAEVYNYVLWCEGRLKELKQAGLLEGPAALTAAGWEEYRKLLESGFVPTKEKVIWTLQSMNVPSEIIETLAALILNNGE